MVLFLYTAILFSFLYTALIIYYRFSWCAIPVFKIKKNVADLITTISVIIPARNEAQFIDDCIQSILNGSYPKHLYEIIVVDDHSEDETAAIVKKYSTQNVQLIFLQNFVTTGLNAYKKKAIEIAVARAKGKLIITTDADCLLPVRWLETLAAFYEEKNAAFIAAPVFINARRRFIEIFQSLDFMTLQGITGAVVHKKQMTMCNGANMAYERSAFYEAGGFAGIDNIASGDDMLLMHKIYTLYPQRVHFLKSAAAIVNTEPVQSIKQFFNQRIRWASKADKYDDKRILPVLVLVYFFNILMLVLPLLALFNNHSFSTASSFFSCSIFMFSTINLWLILLLIKIIAELIFLYPVAKFFGKQKLLWWFPVMQPFHILYTVIAGWLGKFGSYMWKERRVK